MEIEHQNGADETTEAVVTADVADSPKKYHLRTFGCQMNEHDSERIAGLLEDDGYAETDNADEADLVVLNTCCIRENADNKLYGTLGNLRPLKDKNPDLQIAVAGCLAQKDRDTIQERAGHVDVVFGTHNVHRAVELLDEARVSGPLTEIWEETIVEEDLAFPSALPARRATGYSAWLTIQIGCDNTCAFCIVPSVRGKEISRTVVDIVAEATGLAEQGVSEITLLGQNVNSYGRDLAIAARKEGKDVRLRPMFSQLLTDVGAIDGIQRVRFTSPHPKDMTMDVFETMAGNDAVMPHLHFPLQAGSDNILKAMHRGYTAERFLDKVRQARETVADVAITTDIIVGFPGETEDDFAKTLEVAAEAEFDSAFTFVFSPRPGTEAAEMSDKFCDPEEVKDRFVRLRTVTERSAIGKYRERIGKIETVVVEGPSKKDPARLSGRTEQNKMVHFDSDPIRPGTYVSVRVIDSARQYLQGELIEVISKPTHRTKLPVLAL